VAERNGVVLRTHGDGVPAYVFSGLEGSGESCLHLVLPTLTAPPAGRGSIRVVVVDYAEEQHASFDELVATTAALIDEHHAGGPAVVWGQSFGTLYATTVVHELALEVERMVLVSAFRTLPWWKVWLGPPVLTVTPNFLYRATSGPITKWQFGPAGGNTTHPFWDSLDRLPKSDLARRSRWLRGRSFAPAFEAQRPRRGKVWLGSRDNLVNRKAETEFFRGLAERGPFEFAVLEGSGHVVLPPPVIEEARRQLAAWFWTDEEEAQR
jgi:pimeloyl-ACP methyl ester carboxylesterase